MIGGSEGKERRHDTDAVLEQGYGGEMPGVTFSVPYPGAAASSNHGYAPIMRTARDGSVKPGFRMTREARDFKAECVVLARQAWSNSPWLPGPGDGLKITLRATFPSRRHADVGNLAKYMVDAVAEALDSYVDGGRLYNDKAWAVSVEAPAYRPGCEPEIEVTVEASNDR